jgi:hypothetical protein
MSHLPSPSILLLVGPDKVSEQARYERGVKVGAQAPSSTLYQQNADLKSATDVVVAETTGLKGDMDAYGKAEAAMKLARTGLLKGVADWDAAYDVFVHLAEKYAAVPADVSGLGGEPRPKVIHPLLAPLGVLLKQDAKRDRLRIQVECAPGLTRTVVQVNNTDPNNAAGWRELDSSGTVHYLPSPAKGTWWVKAACRNSKAISAYSVVVSIAVK